MKNLLLRAAIGLLVVSVVIPSAAAMTSNELALFEEIPVVFSASRMQEPLAEAPASMSLITADDLEQWGVQDLPDVFRYVVGMDVTAINGREWSVSARGFGSRFAGRMLVLIDGMSAYYPHLSGTNWHELILHNDDIENIEVLRGPNDTGYGFNAFNGVINIKTKDPENTHGFRGRYTYGTQGRDEFFMSVGDGVNFGDAGKLDFRLSYTSHFSQGYGDNNGSEFEDERNYDTLNLRLKHTFNERFNFEYLTGIRYGKYDNPAIPTGSPTHKTSLNNRFMQARLNYTDHERHTAYFQFYHWWHGLDSKLSQAGIGTRDIDEREYDLEFQHTVAFMEGRAETAYGANYRHVAVDSPIIRLKSPGSLNGSQTTRDNRFSAFLNQRFTLLENQDYIKKLSVIGGIRMEGSQFIPTIEWAPRVSLMYQPVQDHNFRLTYARAFKLPSFIEEHAALLSPANTGALAQVVGNRDVKREQVHSYEAGYSGVWLDHKLNIDADIYFAQYQGLTHSVLTQSLIVGVQPAIGTVNNSMDADAFGFKLEAKHRPYDWLQLYSNYTFQHITNQGGSTIGVQVDDSGPRHKANAGINVQLKKNTIESMPFLEGTSLNFNLNYRDAYTYYDITGVSRTAISIEPHIRADFRIAKTLMDDAAEIALVGQNIFSKGHLDARFVEVPRMLFLSVTLKDWPWEVFKEKTERKKGWLAGGK